MKKLVFAALIVMLALTIITCDSFTTPQDKEIELTDVVYSADGSSVTLYLEGGAPQTEASRTLTKEFAQRGHDFFEVIFFNSTTSLARASWGIGDSARVSNVPRGVNYDDASKAVLFVGTRDGTLLAVGKLTAVDGVTATTVAATSTSVTFTVVALEAGVAYTQTLPADPVISATSCFDLTTSAAGLATTTDGATFPAFKVANASATAIPARYTLGATTGTIGITDLLPGIIVSAAPNVEMRFPRYPKDGAYRTFEQISDKTAVIITAPTANTALTNPLSVSIATDQAGNTDGFISFTFKIPVYAISNAALAGQPASFKWNIMPGFGSNAYDLDNGNRNLGGAILLAVGTVAYNNIAVTTAQQ